MKDKYVLDSSVWIEIERSNPTILERTKSWIEKNQVCLIDVIVAELLRGVRTQRDYDLLKAAFADFTQLTTQWLKVAQLAFRVSRKGFQPPLIDLYIAQCVSENKKTLITLDRHFIQIAKIQPFKVEVWRK